MKGDPLVFSPKVRKIALSIKGKDIPPSWKIFKKAEMTLGSLGGSCDA